MAEREIPERRSSWREKLFVIIYEADTPAGKAFDVVLIVSILLSIGVVLLESLEPVRARAGEPLRVAEWTFTILFTIEYVLRLISVPRASTYARSFFGVVDLLAILPTWLSVFFPGGQYLLAVRALRVLRIFRVFKLAHYTTEGSFILTALWLSRRKIIVFLTAVIIIVLVVGSLMYLIEGERSGFDSIPRAMYWAIVTMTTVGYGDISPQTAIGQFIASLLMILGYGIIAVPTGIVTAEMTRAATGRVRVTSCPSCLTEDHDMDAQYCKRCGASLPGA